MNPEELAILIPTRNRPEILARTLDELRAGGFEAHPLWIYDDASDDPQATEHAVAARWPNANVIRGTVRGGQAKGRNQLMAACTTQLALMLDDDSWPEDRNKLALAVQLMVVGGISVATFQCRSLADGRLSIPPEQARGPASSFLAGASVFHVPKILQLGGYREEFVYGYEEPELAMRMWLAGCRIEQFPDVVVAHNHFETAGENRNVREYDYLYARNAILMSSLNLPLVLGLPHGLLRSVRRSLHARRNASSLIRGTFMGIRDTFVLWRMRRPASWIRALAWLRFSKGQARR